jgi:hypothetical protein
MRIIIHITLLILSCGSLCSSLYTAEIYGLTTIGTFAIAFNSVAIFLNLITLAFNIIINRTGYSNQ